MRLESRKYLDDMRRAAALLSEFTTTKTLADYEADAMLRAAVERQFAIIGEAMTQLARIDATTAARDRRVSARHRVPQRAHSWLCRRG